MLTMSWAKRIDRHETLNETYFTLDLGDINAITERHSRHNQFALAQDSCKLACPSVMFVIVAYGPNCLSLAEIGKLNV